MKLPLAILTAALLFLGGCTNINNTVSQGGGNDFPNATMGKVIAEGISKGDNWDDSVSLPKASSPTSTIQGISIPQASTGLLGKLATSNQSIHFDFSDTATLGIVRMYSSLTTDTSIVNDTLIILYDAIYHDATVKDKHLYSYQGASTSKTTLVKTAYRYVDADGDSIINNKDGKQNNVFISIAKTNVLGIIDISDLIFDGGIDGNLDSPNDNRVHFCHNMKVSKLLDTISDIRYESYSNDSIIIDPSTKDSSLIYVHSLERDILKRQTTTDAIFLIYPQDSLKNRPVYFCSRKNLLNGSVITSLIRKNSSDSLFYGNDTILSSRIIDAPGEVITNDTLTMKVLLGKNANDTNSNSLLSLYCHTIKGKADDRETILSFASDSPILHGQNPMAGTFTLYITYASGLWIRVDGRFSSTTINAKALTSRGETKEFVWDRNGNPK